MGKAKQPTTRQLALAAEAAERVAAGKSPTKPQQRAVAIAEAYAVEAAAVELCSALPKGYYAKWAGRPRQVLITQAKTWGLPYDDGGDVVDLPAVIKWWHDFLGEQSAKLRRAGSGDDWREQQRREEYLISRLKRLERAGALVPIEEVREVHVRMIAAIRGLGDRLERQFGGEARDILNDTLAALQREIDETAEREVGDDGNS